MSRFLGSQESYENLRNIPILHKKQFLTEKVRYKLNWTKILEYRIHTRIMRNFVPGIVQKINLV